MSKNVTSHTTLEGEVLFMSAARAFKNKKNGKEEFSIKVKLKDSDPAIKHLKEVAEYKVDTKTNRALEGTGEVIVSFTSSFAPLVVDMHNKILKDKEIPFFDGRKDKATALVGYKVIDFGDNRIVRLAKITLTALTLAPRGDSLETTIEKLKSL